MSSSSSSSHEDFTNYTLNLLDDDVSSEDDVNSCRESLHNFTMCIIDLYAIVYLGVPTLHDIQSMLEGHEMIHGFPSIMGNIDSFVKEFSSAVDEKRSYFTRKQVAARKDVERTFGILQGRWYILQQPAKAYEVNQMRQLMYTCIILHNIIFEDNGYNLSENDWVYEPVLNLQCTWIERCGTRPGRTGELRYREMYESLRSNLVEHLWSIRE
ncbi:uncharacterized protein [Rutidosis leptorrhynchoides]|uniref:uncharacterized protein n=1 Tax=Rutidosis leptorrhynchoides TaxID=125765 RepID=UPI003A98DE47